MPFSLRHIVIAVVLLGLFSGSRMLASDQSNAQPNDTSNSSSAGARTPDTANGRVAEGEYKVLSENGIGPFEPAVYDFDESWTLSRLPDGTFEVKGKRSYRSPSYESHNNEFSVHLSRDFSILGLKEFRRLRWRRDSGPLSCDFLPKKIACTSNAKDKSQNVSLELPMEAAFGFMWPISAFSLGSITRTAAHRPDALTSIELMTFEEASSSDPVLATTLSGHLKYLGQEPLTIAGRTWRADKFELKVPMHAPFLLWTSADGLLLAFSYENANKTLAHDGMELTRFQQWGPF